MNRFLHLLRKDLSAFRFAFGILAFGFMLFAVPKTAITFATVHPGSLIGLLSMLAGGAMTREVMIFLIVVLAGGAVAVTAAVVQEDNMVETTAFWRTRPVGRTNLLLAKVVCLALFAVPALVPLFTIQTNSGPVWLQLWQVEGAASIVLITAAIAALTSSLRHFLLSFALASGAFGFLFSLAEDMNRYRGGWGQEQVNFALVATGLLCGLALACHYLGARRLVGGAILTAAFVLGPMAPLI